MSQFKQGRAPRNSGGFTIIELMVSMVIGLSVLGAMYSAYFTTTTSTRTGRAITQITEDASVAMNILRAQIGHTGYSRPVSAGAGDTLNRAAASTTAWLFGCDGNFLDMTQAISALACTNPLTGSTDPTGLLKADTVATAMEATVENSVTTKVSGVDQPVDCLGNAFVAGAYPGTGDQRTGTATYTYYQSYSRFYLSSGSLYCRGSASKDANAGQPLVDNIADMQITYGLAANPATRVVAYKTAAQVSAAAAWSRVLSVRICLLVRSVDNVMDKSVANTYQGCDPFAAPSSPADSNDFRMYRPFTSTIFLHERLLP
jgi:type IV pilus assembly protein PilW